MPVVETLLGGVLALTGVALQQAFATFEDRQRRNTDLHDRRRAEEHSAFIEVAKAARRVQRALVDVEESGAAETAQTALGRQIDTLTEAVAVVRLVVTDADVVRAVEAVEDLAKSIERALLTPGQDGASTPLRLTPMLDVLRRFEQANYA